MITSLYFEKVNNIWELDEKSYNNKDSELLERMKGVDEDNNTLAHVCFQHTPAKDEEERKIIDDRMKRSGYTAMYKQFETSYGATYVCPSVDEDGENQRYFISEYMSRTYLNGEYADIYYIKSNLR